MTDTPDIVERLLWSARGGSGLPVVAREAAAEIERLRYRIVDLEAAHAVALGTVPSSYAAVTVTHRRWWDVPLPEDPFSIKHNVPGNAPV